MSYVNQSQIKHGLLEALPGSFMKDIIEFMQEDIDSRTILPFIQLSKML